MGKIHRKIVAAGVCCLMTGMLTGCGSDTTKITEGMQLVETLDYQGALNAFDEAEAQKEDSRLIARGRGIASMGLTEYDQAVEYFTQALELSDGWVQNVDYDMNYYLAAAYTKNGQPAEAKKVYDAILGLKPEEKDAYFLRGSAELELGDYESAKADFDQAISMDPKNYDRLIEIYEADRKTQFPDKYDTYIEEGGTNVSGGQKQRLCIARALLKNPKVLILDDSTSAVDTKTDSMIRAALKKNNPDVTKIIVAQRIQSVQEADQIIVMNNGRIDDIGTHEELMKKSEVYRSVYYAQNKGGAKDGE